MGANKKIHIMVTDPVSQFLCSHDREICRRLAAHGHQVTLATTEGYAFDNTNEPFEQMVLFRRIGGRGNIVLKGLNYLRSLVRLFRQSTRANVEVVVLYFHLLPFADAILIRLLEAAGRRTVLCVHEAVPVVANKDRFGAHRLLYQAAPRIITFSAYTRDQLIETMGVSPEKVTALYFGLLEEDSERCLARQQTNNCKAEYSGPCDSEAGAVLCPGLERLKLDARRALDLGLEQQIILCFGQIRPNKGLDILLTAFSKVAQALPAAHLVVAGRPLKVDVGPFLRAAEALGISSRVTFRFEFVPEDHVQDYFCAADVVVIPYTYLYQSAVLPVACSLCKPIVATKVGNVTEVLTDGESAYLTEPGDVEGLISGITAALSDPAEAQSRGCRARKAAQKKYSWDDFCDGLVNILNSD